MSHRTGAISPCILVLGVNPFEDLPGYQLLGLLHSLGNYQVTAADDSQPALDILCAGGARVRKIPHPNEDRSEFLTAVHQLCIDSDIDLVLVGTDAALYALMDAMPDEPWIARVCPYLAWMARTGLENKWEIQEWLGRIGLTPQRRPYNGSHD